MKKVYQNDKKDKEEVPVSAGAVKVIQPKEMTVEELRNQAKKLEDCFKRKEFEAEKLKRDSEAEIKKLQENAKKDRDEAAKLRLLADKRESEAVIAAQNVEKAQKEVSEPEKKPKAKKIKSETSWCPGDLVGKELAGKYAGFTGEKKFYLALGEDNKYWPFLEYEDAVVRDQDCIVTPPYLVKDGTVMCLMSIAEESAKNFKN